MKRRTKRAAELAEVRPAIELAAIHILTPEDSMYRLSPWIAVLDSGMAIRWVRAGHEEEDHAAIDANLLVTVPPHPTEEGCKGIVFGFICHNRPDLEEYRRDAEARIQKEAEGGTSNA